MLSAMNTELTHTQERIEKRFMANGIADGFQSSEQSPAGKNRIDMVKFL